MKLDCHNVQTTFLSLITSKGVCSLDSVTKKLMHEGLTADNNE